MPAGSGLDHQWTALELAILQARALRPCIVFMDEIDAVGRVRGGARGNDERDQTLNQMLSEMDGFDAESGVIVMAATNRCFFVDWY